MSVVWILYATCIPVTILLKRQFREGPQTNFLAKLEWYDMDINLEEAAIWQVL
jgi:hypothetical protein